MTEGLKHINEADRLRMRAAVDSDSFLFLRSVCGYDKLDFYFHSPICYAMAGQTDKLVSLLTNKEFMKLSWTGREIKRRLEKRHGLDIYSFSDQARISNLLDFLDVRVYRGAGKSSIAHGVDAWDHARDPEATVLICSCAEDRAISFSRQIKEIYLSQMFKALYPDRIGDELNYTLTDRRISLAGRSARSPQAGIEAWGYTASIVGAHFNKFSIDDLTIDTNLHDLDGVSRFLAGLSGLYEPRRVRRVHVGTVWDERDDHWVLSQIPNCLSIVVPIEDYFGDEVMDLWQRGEPTNPTWHSYDGTGFKDIEELKGEVLSNVEEGPTSWRVNYLLDPTLAGGRIFPSRLVEESTYVVVDDDTGRSKYGFYFARQSYDPVERTPIRNEDDEDIYTAADPGDMRIVVGCDQAVSDEGDEWGVVVLGRDINGVNYVVYSISGHGYQGMLDQILAVNDHYRPEVIGLEKGGMQDSTFYWLTVDKRFAPLRGKIKPVSQGSSSKLSRIVNMVADPMRMRQLFIPPDDHKLIEEMVKYKPSDKASDGLLDAIAIASAVMKSPISNDRIQQRAQQQQKNYLRKVDSLTGLYVG